MKLIGLSGIIGLVAPVMGLDNGLALTPPMGWRSWNCYHGDVTQAHIKATVDAITARTRMVDGKLTSLLDVGYDHVGVDDGWQLCNAGVGGNSFHGPTGKPILNTSKFTNLTEMVAHGHDQNVKMGWYDTNCMCCDEYIINRGNATYTALAYAADVQMLYDHGFDSIKQDNCGDDQGTGFAARMEHINASGKPLLVEDSDQGHGLGAPRGLPDDADGWCGSNMFRAEGDVSQ
jgi:alpha-galactosidase